MGGVYMQKKLLVIISGILLLLSGCSLNDGESENEIQNDASASWAYPFVKWENETYVVSEEEVKEDKLGQEIGKVTSYSDLESSNTSGNFSNEYEVGTKYYEITDISQKEAIAIEVKKGKFIKAVISDKWEE